MTNVQADTSQRLTCEFLDRFPWQLKAPAKRGYHRNLKAQKKQKRETQTEPVRQPRARTGTG